MIGFLGDIHGRFEVIPRALSMPGVDAWLQVGDLGGDLISYPDLPQGFWFIKGNHENWKELELIKTAPEGPYLRNGKVYDIPMTYTKSVVRVAVMGGNYSPKYSMWEKDKVPPSRARHFLQEDRDRLLAENGDVDILITHEAPSPYMRGSQDIGQPWITELSVHLKPKIHVFGHHHRYGAYECGGVKTLGLEYGWSHCVLWDEKTGEHRWESIPG
jgi:predicted phosphodiesterase